MQLNQNQILAIVIGVLSLLVGSTAQLNDLFGPSIAKYIISSASLGTGIVSVILTVLTSQGSTIKTVAAMPGIERVEVNENANKTAAVLAMDSTQSKIVPTEAAMAAVIKTAQS